MAKPMYSYVIAASLVFFTATGEFAFAQSEDGVASGTDSSEPGVDGAVTPPAKKKRKKKPKTRRKKPADPAADIPVMPEVKEGEAAVAGKPGTGIHANQIGIDNPYSWHMAMLSSFGKTERKQGDTKTGNASYNLQIKALYIIGAMFEVGPEIEFFESSAKNDGNTNKNSSWVASLVMALNFGNIDTDVFVPFVDLKVGSGQDTEKFGDNKTVSSVTQFGLGLGLHWFVDSNVAFTARTGYSAGTAKSKTTANGETTDGGDPVKSTSIDYLDLGFSLFL